MSSAYQMYRSTSIGLALDDTLGELVHRQILTSRAVQYILCAFDQIMNQKLSSRLSKGKKEACLLFKGHLLSYRACDQVWTLVFDSLTFTSNIDSSWKLNLNGQNNKIKIITCPAIKLTQSNTEQISTNEDDQQIKSKTNKKFKSN